MSRLLVISPNILCVAGCGYELWSHRGSFVDALPFLCVMAWAAVLHDLHTLRHLATVVPVETLRAACQEAGL